MGQWESLLLRSSSRKEGGDVFSPSPFRSCHTDGLTNRIEALPQSLLCHLPFFSFPTSSSFFLSCGSSIRSSLTRSVFHVVWWLFISCLAQSRSHLDVRLPSHSVHPSYTYACLTEGNTQHKHRKRPIHRQS